MTVKSCPEYPSTAPIINFLLLLLQDLLIIFLTSKLSVPSNTISESAVIESTSSVDKILLENLFTDKLGNLDCKYLSITSVL